MLTWIVAALVFVFVLVVVIAGAAVALSAKGGSASRLTGFAGGSATRALSVGLIIILFIANCAALVYGIYWSVPVFLLCSFAIVSVIRRVDR